MTRRGEGTVGGVSWTNALGGVIHGAVISVLKV